MIIFASILYILIQSLQGYLAFPQISLYLDFNIRKSIANLFENSWELYA